MAKPFVGNQEDFYISRIIYLASNSLKLECALPPFNVPEKSEKLKTSFPNTVDFLLVIKQNLMDKINV